MCLSGWEGKARKQVVQIEVQGQEGVPSLSGVSGCKFQEHLNLQAKLEGSGAGARGGVWGEGRRAGRRECASRACALLVACASGCQACSRKKFWKHGSPAWEATSALPLGFTAF